MNFTDKFLNFFRSRQPGDILGVYDLSGNLISANLLNPDISASPLIEAVKNISIPNPDTNVIIKSCYVDNISSLRGSTPEELSQILATSSNIESVSMKEAMFFLPHHSGTFNQEVIANYVKEHYPEYLNSLLSEGTHDIPRTPEFLSDIVNTHPDIFRLLPESEMTKELCTTAMSCDPYNFKYIPEEFKTADLCCQMIKNCQEHYIVTPDLFLQNTSGNPEFLPKNLTQEELGSIIKTIVDIDIDSQRKEFGNLYPDSGKIENYKVLHHLPDDFHKHYNLSEVVGSDVYSYYLVTNNKEFSPKQAEEAMHLYATERFSTNWDPIGADYMGGLMGCDYYVHPNLENPKDYFPADVLSTQQWHDIVEIDSNMINHIPSEVVERKEFWNDYESLIGKGSYLTQPDTDYLQGRFDEYEVFSKMPSELQKDPQVYNTLLEKDAISFDFFEKPSEETCLKFGYKYYTQIPDEFIIKDNFRDVARQAVEYDSNNIVLIPSNFISEEMIKTAVHRDPSLLSILPPQSISEDFLLTLVNHSDKAVKNDLSEIQRPEQPLNIKAEVKAPILPSQDLTKSSRNTLLQQSEISM